MTQPPEHPTNRIPAMKAAEQAELDRLDGLLARVAAAERARTPGRLIDRVFEASAALLPEPAILRGPWRAPQEAPSRLRLARASMWGRLALAASVALAFVIAHQPLTGSRSSVLSPEVALVVSNTGSDPMLNILGSSRGNDAAYMESFGIFDTRADDFLGEISLMLQAAPGS